MSAGPALSPLRATHAQRIAVHIEDINRAIGRAKGIRAALDPDANTQSDLATLIADLATIRATAFELQANAGALVMTGQADWLQTSQASQLELHPIHAPLPVELDRKRAAANDHE